jgi:Flp pilus assembly protein TadG
MALTSTLRRLAVRRPRGEDGSYTLMLAVLALGIAVAIGLVVDAGGRLQAEQRAQALASEAARAAGQAINPGQAIANGTVVIDPAAAVQAGDSYLATAGVTGTVVPKGADSVQVTVTVTYQPPFTGALGAGTQTITVTESADLVTGVTAP